MSRYSRTFPYVVIRKIQVHFCYYLTFQSCCFQIANMEDLTTEFMDRCSDFSKVFEDHIGKRLEYKDNLDS